MSRARSTTAFATSTEIWQRSASTFLACSISTRLVSAVCAAVTFEARAFRILQLEQLQQPGRVEEFDHVEVVDEGVRELHEGIPQTGIRGGHGPTLLRRTPRRSEPWSSVQAMAADDESVLCLSGCAELLPLAQSRPPATLYPVLVEEAAHVRPYSRPSPPGRPGRVGPLWISGRGSPKPRAGQPRYPARWAGTRTRSAGAPPARLARVAAATPARCSGHTCGAIPGSPTSIP